MKWSLLALFLSQSLFALAPGEATNFIQFPKTNNKMNSGWSKVLLDVVNHEAPGDSNSYDDKVTLSHETTHGIHSYIRIKMNNTGKKANGFYVLEDRAVVVVEPNIRKSNVAKYIPASLRGPRYGTYITGQTEWDDTPLYIWDEWNAYVNGGAAGVDLVQQGLWNTGWRDAVAGVVEFVAYALATGQAVRELDTQYFYDYTQFREFMAFNIKRSMDIFKAGYQMSQFKYDVQEKFWNDLKTSPDAAALRDFARDTFGGAWTSDVLGF